MYEDKRQGEMPRFNPYFIGNEILRGRLGNI